MVHHFRAVEKIALEQRVSHPHARGVFLLGLHFFSKHANAIAAIPGDKRELFFLIGNTKIHLDDVGKSNQRPPAGRIDEVVERDRISRLLQSPAGIDYLLIGLDGFENFDYHRIAREQRNVIPQEEIAGAVDEHEPSPGDFF